MTQMRMARHLPTKDQFVIVSVDGITTSPATARGRADDDDRDIDAEAPAGASSLL